MPAFENCRIYVSVPENLVPAFPRDDVLTAQITIGGGMVCGAPKVATHIICHNMQQDQIAEFEQTNAELCSIVWYFGCIQAKRPLSSHPLYRPFPASAIPSAAEHGEVTITGFSNIDRIAAACLIQAVGLEYNREMNLFVPDATVTRQSALLIAKDVNVLSPKTTAARKHGIPVVNLKWIIDCLEQWTLVPLSGYLESATVSLVFSPRTSPIALLPPPDQLGKAQLGVIEDSEEEAVEKDSNNDDEKDDGGDNTNAAVENKAREPSTAENRAPTAAAAADPSDAPRRPGSVSAARPTSATAARPGSASGAGANSGKVGFGSEFTLSGLGGGATEAMGAVGALVGALCQETEVEIYIEQHALRLTSAPPPAAIVAAEAVAAATVAEAVAEAAAAPSAEKKPLENSEDDDDDETPTPSELSLDDKFTQRNKPIGENEEEKNSGGGGEVFLPPTEPDHLPFTEAMPDYMEEDNNDDYNGDDDDVDVGYLDASPEPSLVAEEKKEDDERKVEKEDLEKEEKEERKASPPQPSKKKTAEDEDLKTSLVGRRVEKEFDGQMYGGVVKEYLAVEGWFEILYDDGDVEDIGPDEVQKLLIHSPAAKHQQLPSIAAGGDGDCGGDVDNAPADAAHNAAEKKTRERKRKPTPAVSSVEHQQKEKAPVQQLKRARGRKQPTPSIAPTSQPAVLPMKEKIVVRRSFRAKKEEDVVDEKPTVVTRTRQARGNAPSATKAIETAAPAPVKAAPAAPETKEKKQKKNPTPTPPPVVKPSTKGNSTKPESSKSTAKKATPAAAAAVGKQTKSKTPATKTKAKPVAPPSTKQKKQKSLQAHIALSGMHTAEQKEMVERFSRIRGVEITSSLPGDLNHDWKPEFTHVIAPELKRNQKCLAALASGAWIVSPAFAAACQAAGKVVNAEPFELEIARFWRVKRNERGSGAFNGLSFAILARGLDEPPSRDDITAIIKAGGGSILPISSQADIVISGKSTSTATSSVQSQLKGGALCVTSMYIVDWLSKPHSNLEEHVLAGGEKKSKAITAAEAARGAEQQLEPESSISL
jgi:hypothetical protein